MWILHEGEAGAAEMAACSEEHMTAGLRELAGLRKSPIPRIGKNIYHWKTDGASLSLLEELDFIFKRGKLCCQSKIDKTPMQVCIRDGFPNTCLALVEHGYIPP